MKIRYWGYLLVGFLLCFFCAKVETDSNNTELTSSTYITPHLMICANDQRFILTDGLGQIHSNPGLGSLSVLDFSMFPPKANHLANVPCSVIGPPTCVAITPDESIALVASAMKVDPQVFPVSRNGTG